MNASDASSMSGCSSIREKPLGQLIYLPTHLSIMRMATRTRNASRPEKKHASPASTSANVTPASTSATNAPAPAHNDVTPASEPTTRIDVVPRQTTMVCIEYNLFFFITYVLQPTDLSHLFYFSGSERPISSRPQHFSRRCGGEQDGKDHHGM